MGKSDRIIYPVYLNFLETDTPYDSVGFYGQSSENDFSRMIKAKKKYFYDLSLDNWNINSYPYHSEEKLDLIVCTRCAYFSRDPGRTVKEFTSILKKGGTILIDWGLGDHWRFKDYKVGWVKNKEQEWAYENENFLWSTVWDDSFKNNPEYKKFSKWVEKFGYYDVEKAVLEEVPQILYLKDVDNLSMQVSIVALWEESPQLYVVVKAVKH